MENGNRTSSTQWLGLITLIVGVVLILVTIVALAMSLAACACTETPTHPAAKSTQAEIIPGLSVEILRGVDIPHGQNDHWLM